MPYKLHTLSIPPAPSHGRSVGRWGAVEYRQRSAVQCRRVKVSKGRIIFGPETPAGRMFGTCRETRNCNILGSRGMKV